MCLCFSIYPRGAFKAFIIPSSAIVLQLPISRLRAGFTAGYGLHFLAKASSES